jgi:homoserine dehydrogenase
MAEALRVGIAGLGVVGQGLLELFAAHGADIGARCGRAIEITAVSSRNRSKSRSVDIARFAWFDDPVDLAESDRIDVFVELIGGSEGPAKTAVEMALRSGKHVVTANKALLARHGVPLARIAEAHGVALNFEAAVAGGVPIVKTLRESLVGNRISRVFGILNGTTNYILTRMQQEGRSFADVLREAQDAGYAEADPTFDIGGFDTAHKLAILTSLAFGVEASFDSIYLEGIETITPADIEAADELGYRIKLLGVAQLTESGIEQRVHPTMTPKHSAIAEVEGVTNCVAIEGDFVGNVMLIGPGAGARPTASSVMSDIIDISRGVVLPPFITPAEFLKPCERAAMRAHEGGYYIRLSVYDRTGAFAAIAARMAEQGISLEAIMQKREGKELPGFAVRGKPNQPVPVVMITQRTTEAAMRLALEAIERDGHVDERPQMIRIERL